MFRIRSDVDDFPHQEEAENGVVEITVVEEEVVPVVGFVDDPFVTHKENVADDVCPTNQIDEMAGEDVEVGIEDGGDTSFRSNDLVRIGKAEPVVGTNFKI